MFGFLKNKPPQIGGYDWNDIDPALWSKFPSLADRCHMDIHQHVVLDGLGSFLRSGMIATNGMFDIEWLWPNTMSLRKNLECECYASVLFGELNIIRSFKQQNPNFQNLRTGWGATPDANGIISHWSDECAARILFRKNDLRENIYGKSFDEVDSYLNRAAS
jgi:hypothetical protein